MLDLKKYLHVKLRNVPQDWARTPTVVEAAPKALALPLVAAWSGYYGLLEDASVVFVPYDEPQAGRPELDARIRNMALFQGARRYPELSALVPTRGEDDETCSSETDVYANSLMGAQLKEYLRQAAKYGSDGVKAHGDLVMIVHLSDVQQAFDELIAGTRSREELSSWARSLRISDDEGQLLFEPAAMQDLIWRSIIYLEGIDLKDSPNTYLHISEDFIAFRAKLGI